MVAVPRNQTLLLLACFVISSDTGVKLLLRQSFTSGVSARE
jgi:hypothetical protein